MHAIRRLLTAIPVIVVVACGTFTLVYLIPGDPASTVAGEGATLERIAQVRSELGLDQPFLTQFTTWIAHAIVGNFGESMFYHVSVWGLIGDRAAVSISIVIVGWVFAVLIGVPAGLVAGTRSVGSSIARSRR